MDLTAQADSSDGPPDRPAHFSTESEASEIEITLDMISAGVAAYDAFDSECEDPEALIFSIIYRAFRLARQTRIAAPDESFLQEP